MSSRLVVALALSLSLSSVTVSCTGPGPLPVVADAVIDCLGQNRPQIDQLLSQLSPLIFLQSPDWDAVYSRVKEAGKEIGGCAAAELVQRYLTPGTGRTAPEPTVGWAARDRFNQYRVTEAGGATFKTSLGAL